MSVNISKKQLSFLILPLALVLAGTHPISADGKQSGSKQKDNEPLQRKIPWGKVTRYGLFRARAKGFTRIDSKTSTGKSIRKPTLEFSEGTQRIPLRIGVYFGYQYWLKLPPGQSRPELRRILIHPQMTLPDGSKVSRSERTFRKKATHGIVTAIDAYALSENYELIEGDWLFQLWYQDKMLMAQQFTTYWPGKEKPAEIGSVK